MTAKEFFEHHKAGTHRLLDIALEAPTEEIGVEVMTTIIGATETYHKIRGSIAIVSPEQLDMLAARFASLIDTLEKRIAELKEEQS